MYPFPQGFSLIRRAKENAHVSKHNKDKIRENTRREIEINHLVSVGGVGGWGDQTGPTTVLAL